jgi:predicted nucleic acid-binding protein
VLAKTSDLTDNMLDKGLASKFSDFEDSLQYYSALKKDCNIIITRNVKDFRESDINVLTPDEYVNSLKTK